MQIINKIKQRFSYFLHGAPQAIYANVTLLAPNKSLTGKRVIITGGGRGLGFAMAKKFVSEGAEVLIAGRNEETLKKASSEIKCKYVVLDVMDVDSFDEFLDTCEMLMPNANCLVNNAGISLHEGRFMDVTKESFDTQMITNLRGSYFMAQKFINRVVKKHIAANVLFISSEKGIFVDNMPYGLTKCSINSLAQALSCEFIKKSIRVNVLAPGVTTSDMTGRKEDGSLYASYNVNGRLYIPSEVAEVANFLLSDASSCLSGQIIATNEGKTVNNPLEIKMF